MKKKQIIKAIEDNSKLSVSGKKSNTMHVHSLNVNKLAKDLNKLLESKEPDEDTNRPIDKTDIYKECIVTCDQYNYFEIGETVLIESFRGDFIVCSNGKRKQYITKNQLKIKKQ